MIDRHILSVADRANANRSSGLATLAASFDLAEGPIWDDRSSRLSFVDIGAGSLHHLDPQLMTVGGWPVDGIGAAVAREAGGFVAAAGSGFALVDARGHVKPFAAIPGRAQATRMNDGRCDVAGRFIAGSVVGAGTTPSGALWRLDTDGSVVLLIAGLYLPNGVDWSPDGSTMYFVDSQARSVYAVAYDMSSGAVGDRRLFVRLEADRAMPDGLTVDADGYVWVSLWDGWSVRRYRPDGVLDRVVDVPAALVTSCGFGGPSLDDLYITTARTGLSDAECALQPGAGAVLRLAAGVQGRRQARYAG